MDEFAQELADLTADLKAILLDAHACGVLSLGMTESDPKTNQPNPPPQRTPGQRTPGQRTPGQRTPGQRTPTVVTTVSAPPLDSGGPLERIQAELMDCQRCSLSTGRTKLVFGAGNPTADLLVVGEAPGGQEDRAAVPLVGPAGRMLDDMLKHVLGLQRDQVYITNVVKCRPPSNRTPLQEELDTCRTFLERQVQAVDPKVILSLGGAAALTLLRCAHGIKEVRGEWGSFAGVPVLPTFHPTYLLKQPQDKRLVFEDLKALRQRYDDLGGIR